ncbi:predicted protein [Uncinocarpus reesii 1704]|uniref:XPG-I domain-containing protein n=1 Tax=Uncinocarpus reesii (strain UAMH 1704) TaxID=336963 RepID=C4JYP1_UNCRE|nr:uncharacterized protein UREG_07292 [Uncinocarpus reesii 1704]EEP82427.1 predicted protein [Uncinocarpus reesii 1704]
MGIPGLVQELGSGDRISLAKFAIDHLQRTARPVRIAVDASIWLFQVQSAQGGLNPELRALFYRLARLLALPIQPLFVFDGPERPEYKRGKLIARNGGSHIIGSFKRLIELFGFNFYDAPGEAEAQCAKLQIAGIVDASLSNDIDTLMFGSQVTLLNFSKASPKNSGPATHVNVYRHSSPNANVTFDTAGMVLFALLSGGDYLPAGVPRCGPKLAAEIVRAGFGADLLDIIKSNPKDLDAPLNEWRERLDYELSTNESGYFKSKHKAVKIPKDFPDLRVLLDYISPVTSTEKEVEKLESLQWNQKIDVSSLKQFVCDKLGWDGLAGQYRFIRTIAPSLLCCSLRDSTVNPIQAKIRGRKENINMDGLAELKLQFVPADVVGIELESELGPTSSAAIDVAESDSEDDQIEPPSSATKRTPYDPTKEQILWVFEALVVLGMPTALKNWNDEQEQKKLAASKPQGSAKGSRKGKKAVDSGMAPGALHRYGTVVKTQTKTHGGSRKSTQPAAGGYNPCENRRDSTSNQIQKTIADCAAFTVRSTKSGTSSLPGVSKSPKGMDMPTSSDIEAAMALGHSDEGRLPSSKQRNHSNYSDSVSRIMDRVEAGSRYITISSSDEDSDRGEKGLKPCQTKGEAKAPKPKFKSRKPAALTSDQTPSRTKPRLRTANVLADGGEHITPEKSSQISSKSLCEQAVSFLDQLLEDCKSPDSTKTEISSKQPNHGDLMDGKTQSGLTHTPDIFSRNGSSTDVTCNTTKQPRSTKKGKRSKRISIIDLT